MKQDLLPPVPAHGEVWIASLDPIIGHEQQGMRPVLVISINDFNLCGAERAIVVPITTKGSQRPFRVAHRADEGGLAEPGWVLCDQIRSVSTLRFRRCCGDISDETLGKVQDQLAVLLDL